MMTSKTSQAGFNLMELMITVVIIGILAAFAYPSYLDSSRKAKRTDAKSMLLDVASRQEKYFAANASYARTMTDLGFSASPMTTDNSLYSVTISSATPASPANATAYTATATALGDQIHDSCDGFSITNIGTKGVTEGTVANCW